jgi:large subunit ribosomal protein L5
MAKTDTKHPALAPAKGPAKVSAKPQGKTEAKAPAKPAEGAPKSIQEPTGPPRLQEVYRQQVVPAMMKAFSYKNEMQVPRVHSVVLNVGMGKATQNAKLLESAVEELALISGQRPVVTRARKAIANFKLRKGLAIGAKVTLRGRRMFEFLDRLFTMALPRIRDFKGISPKSFDGRGNYTLGLKEQLIFPEIKYDQVQSIHGMDITIVTSANTNEEGKALLKELGVPFRA